MISQKKSDKGSRYNIEKIGEGSLVGRSKMKQNCWTSFSDIILFVFSFFLLVFVFTFLLLWVQTEVWVMECPLIQFDNCLWFSTPTMSKGTTKEVQIVYRLSLVNCYLLHVPTLDSGINVAPGINVVPLLKIFTSRF